MPLLSINCSFLSIILATAKESIFVEIIHKIFCPIPVQVCWAKSLSATALDVLYQLKVSYLISNFISWPFGIIYQLDHFHLCSSDILFFPWFAEHKCIYNLSEKFNAVMISDPMHSESILFIGIILYLLLTAFFLEMFGDHCWMQFWLESN